MVAYTGCGCISLCVLRCTYYFRTRHTDSGWTKCWRHIMTGLKRMMFVDVIGMNFNFSVQS